MAALKKAVDKKENVLILDVREPNEFASGYIPGAINIPRGMLEMKIVVLDRETGAFISGCHAPPEQGT